jgi:hypothetical protein
MKRFFNPPRLRIDPPLTATFAVILKHAEVTDEAGGLEMVELSLVPAANICSKLSPA